MRINFYDTRIADDDRIILVKEKGRGTVKYPSC